MARETYEAEMNSLREEMLRLSRMTDRALASSIEILRDRLFEQGEKLIREDEEINLVCYHIEESCLNIIATQQPVAGDLRFIFATMQIAMELERIADYAKGIAVINRRISPGDHIKPLIDIPRMQHKAGEMLEMAIDAFLKCDIESARRIPSMDVEINLLYEQVYRELVTRVMENPRRIADAMLLTFAAHNLERVGDRVINICEKVVYLCTGDVVDMG
ncbi:MAG: phosphate signaling complex protein PhoU [Candidatus Fermentibacteraceae bacterium]|nr:phosphate signaling complex protein PhoU [Candidatus Fermentibacteraceae bacterium]MBN2608793.1 phosphate signaling complex protein PhoU [Candidatus Fermentibacteraceae bacterium]